MYKFNKFNVQTQCTNSTVPISMSSKATQRQHYYYSKKKKTLYHLYLISGTFCVFSKSLLIAKLSCHLLSNHNSTTTEIKTITISLSSPVFTCLKPTIKTPQQCLTSELKINFNRFHTDFVLVFPLLTLNK